MTAVDRGSRIMTGAPARRAMTLRWEISAQAVRRSSLPAIASMNGQAERISRAGLEWRIQGCWAVAMLVLEIGEDDVVVPLGSAAANAWVEDSVSGLSHANFGDLLVVSVRDEDLVYARTALLESSLGLAGGVYDSPVGRGSGLRSFQHASDSQDG